MRTSKATLAGTPSRRADWQRGNYQQQCPKCDRHGNLAFSETLGLLCMRRTTFFLVLITAFLSAVALHTAQAQGLGNYVETYTARLSARDHYNSNGVRLRSAAAIIRQDRANFYVYGLRDSEDEPDPYFSSKNNRARLEELLENGRTTPDAIDRIANGTPLIRVDIYATGISVTILSD
jgi:hypothetical protein